MRVRQVALASVLAWIPLAVLTVGLSGLVYVAVQQTHRSMADDPQIQMARDAAHALASGAATQGLVPANQVDISTSLAPYLVIYDANRQVMAASATLHGEALAPPAGVFDAARTGGMDAITWQPEPGVRGAVVMVAYANGYVLAGRSLEQVELRESSLTLIVGAACVTTLVATLVATLITRALGTGLAAPEPMEGAS